MNKKMKLRYRAVLSLILSAVLFCMPAAAFCMNGNNAIAVRAEDSGESGTEEETEGSTEESTTEQETSEPGSTEQETEGPGAGLWGDVRLLYRRRGAWMESIRLAL